MPRSQSIHPNALQSSRVLVFGGTSGLGYAVASGALANGGKVHVSSSSEVKVSDTVKTLQALYPALEVSGTAADLATTDTVEANLISVLEAAIKRLGGPLDHIIFTAGEFPAFKPLHEVTADTAFSGWTVRYVAPLLIAKLVAANPGIYLSQSSRSSITLTSGVTTSRPRKGISSIIGAVGALETITKSLSLDLAPVRVNIVRVGTVVTELVERFGPAEMSPMAEKTLPKRLGEPWEAAEAYLFSMRSGYTTGQDIVVDGGLSYM